MSTEPSVERQLFDLRVHTEPERHEPHERRDAARNRGLLLDAAHRLVDRDGVAAVTMDAVAAEAGVGKGTVFRRFGSRAGLMTALLDHTEARWQGRVISGPPPLGPGTPPLERLLAFGASRLDRTIASADLMAAAAGRHGRSGPAVAFWTVHVRHLLTELGVTGDLPLLAMALLAPLDVTIVSQQLGAGVSRERILAAWTDLAERVVAGR
ncbi:MAG: TetR/AcrR family transcriptional regulator [Dermatophilaceae bacterium]|nr:TetR/AcrR family transcriptional regulator [Dermatophilaceae bacterium]